MSPKKASTMMRRLLSAGMERVQQDFAQEAGLQPLTTTTRETGTTPDDNKTTNCRDEIQANGCSESHFL
jgi:hypothetical protein